MADPKEWRDAYYQYQQRTLLERANGYKGRAMTYDEFVAVEFDTEGDDSPVYGG